MLADIDEKVNKITEKGDEIGSNSHLEVIGEPGDPVGEHPDQVAHVGGEGLGGHHVRQLFRPSDEKRI